MAASVKNVLIGVFVIAAISIVVFMLLFLHPSVGDNGKTLRVRFNDIDKVNVGTRVTFAGRPVGEVISIQEIPDARTGRTAKNGEIYVYELLLKVDSSVDVFNSDAIMLRTSGLLGERNVEIDPQPLKKGETLRKVEDEILYAEVTSSVEDTMKGFATISEKFGIVLDDVHEILSDIKKSSIVDNASAFARNVRELSESLNQPKKWEGVIDNIYAVTEKAQKSWNVVDDTLNSLQQAAGRVDMFTAKADQLVDYVREGKGSMGQLLVGDELFLRLKSILHKGETVMDDINHYGLLFHLDKKWQRLQGQKLRLLEKFSTPCEFSRYFNQEMELISSSLSKVSRVLDDSLYTGYRDSLIYNPQFTTRFSELLRRVENMEETLKLYNEQVVAEEELNYRCRK